MRYGPGLILLGGQNYGTKNLRRPDDFLLPIDRLTPSLVLGKTPTRAALLTLALHEEMARRHN
jgi:hypothetical protein